MFRAGGHVGFLHALDVGHTLRGGQDRILAHVFEIASAQRTAFDVDGRAENHVLASASGFLQYFTGHVPVGVPCGGDRRAGRQVGHIVTGVVQRRPIVVMQFGAHAHRTIIHPERRNAQSFGVAARNRPAACTMAIFSSSVSCAVSSLALVLLASVITVMRFSSFHCDSTVEIHHRTRSSRKHGGKWTWKKRKSSDRQEGDDDVRRNMRKQGVGPVRRVRRPLLVM